MSQQRKIRKSRSASIILEAVLSVALLATAGVALAKLSRSAAALSKQSDHQIAASLAAENAAQRIVLLTPDAIINNTSEIEKSVAESSGCDVKIIAERFESGEHRGVHALIEVMTPMSARVVRHQWQLDAPENPS